ncbi:MAG: adenylate/guanylate cyclase domain-containing protein [Planctomycetota bacterium]|nr:adenylate/guanylate cyclase domain-containing protein [Planctomycetota bacterium]
MADNVIRYAKSGGLSIAYQITGRGPRDLLLISGFVSHLELDWGHPKHAHFLNRLGSFSRLIRFDKRGTGLSDRPGGLPDLETRMDDVRAVMDAANSQRATILGYSEGGPMAALFAATFPERTEALVIYGSYARRLKDDDYPWGSTVEVRAIYAEQIENDWGWEADMHKMCPSADEAMATWWGERARAAASPGAARALIEMNSLVDVRDVLPAIHVPTLVLHRRGDRDSLVDEGRYIADHIKDAIFIELEGNDHFVAIDPDQILDPVELFVTGKRIEHSTERKLATILFVDIVDSTGKAIVLGDEKWTALLDQFNEMTRRKLDWHNGKFVNTTGDGLVAVFEGPASGIRCGCSIRDASPKLGLEVRCGAHTAEIEVRNGDIAGIGVHVASRIAEAAHAGEVWASRTVKDIIAGSGIVLRARGEHVLKGLAEPLALFTVDN